MSDLTARLLILAFVVVPPAMWFGWAVGSVSAWLVIPAGVLAGKAVHELPLHRLRNRVAWTLPLPVIRRPPRPA